MSLEVVTNTEYTVGSYVPQAKSKTGIPKELETHTVAPTFEEARDEAIDTALSMLRKVSGNPNASGALESTTPLNLRQTGHHLIWNGCDEEKEEADLVLYDVLNEADGLLLSGAKSTKILRVFFVRPVEVTSYLEEEDYDYSPSTTSDDESEEEDEDEEEQEYRQARGRIVVNLQRSEEEEDEEESSSDEETDDDEDDSDYSSEEEDDDDEEESAQPPLDNQRFQRFSCALQQSQQ